MGVLLVRDDHLEEDGIARGGERRAHLDVRGRGRRRDERGDRGGKEGAPDHLSLNLKLPVCVWPSAAFIVHLAV